VDDSVQIAVEDPLRVADLVARPQVLHLLVRVQHVTPDLTSEVRLLHGASFFREFRLSPFDSAHRRHTSFAQVIVSPLLAEDAAAEIDEADLRIDTYRASGAGGQHVNKTDSAVRITHLPTGIVVQCQNERSQTSNKQTALRILRSRLAELEQEQREAELARERGAVQEADFGSQIRSYVLHPYQLVKDHRTDVEAGNAQGVLDGDLDEFVHAYLLARAAGRAV